MSQEQALAPYHETGAQIANLSTPVTKSGMAQVVDGIAKAVMEGDVPVLATMARLQAIKEITEAAQKIMRPRVMREIEKSGTYELAYFKKRNGGFEWDFSECNDPVLEKLVAEQAELKEKIKARSLYLVALAKNGGIDADGCKVDTILPKPTPRTDSLIIEFQD